MTARRWAGLRVLAAAVGGVLPLAACEEKAEPPPVRPVLSVVIAPKAEQVYGFSGTIEPRYQTNLGFRTSGRMVSRNVDVGDTVKAGQEVAAIDPLSLQLAQRSAVSAVSTARAQLVAASAAEQRQRVLVERNVIPQAQYEQVQLQQETAAAIARGTEAGLAKAAEQLSYAKLQAATDGVVTAADAQVGQVVNVGQSVITVARPDVREAAVDVPEAIASQIQPGTAFDIALQLDPTVRAEGKVREIGPQADQTTRLRHVLITLAGSVDLFRLGTTVTATLRLPAPAVIELPRAALLETDGKTMVWVVDPDAGTVSTREIKVSAKDESTFQVAEGLAPGNRVVIAGVHSLQPGQKIKIPDEASR